MRRGYVRAGAAVIVTVALAACGTEAPSTAGATVEGEPRQVAVTLTVAGCDPTSLTIPEGPTTFNVANQDAPAVTEVEIKEGERIIGEKENVVAGVDGSFSLDLAPGTYTMACPGGTTAPTGTLQVVAVTGSPSGSTQSVDTAVAAYHVYVVERAATLVNRVLPFTRAVERGDLERAKSLFAWAREPYEAIEPIAESFGDLDPEIDARENDVPAEGWTGFHRIEKALWVDGSLAGMSPVAQKLRADVGTLQTLIEAVELDPAQIANGSTELLGEVSKSKITGEEDRYSHTDLWDFQANVDGARAGFTALSPVLDAADPQLAAQIRARFRALDRALDPFRRGDGFVLYDELTQSDTRTLSQSIDAVAEPLSLVAGAVVGA